MKARKIILSIFLVTTICSIMSCTKSATISPLQFQKELLAGTGKFQNTQKIWQLDSTKINGTNFPLTPTQKEYKKTFSFDGGYSDTDNNMGKWEINSLNKLKQIIFIQATKKQDSSSYDILSINAAQLNLSLKLSNGQTAIYSFKISY